MQETVRQQMLAAMGQTVLLPRFIFANAKASSILEIESNDLNESLALDASSSSENTEVVNAAPQISEPTVNAPEQVKSVDAAKETLQKFLPENSELANRINANLDSDKASDALEDLRFRHGVFVLPKLICLVDQPTLELADAAKYQQFFGNIHTALFAEPSAYINHRTFEWPLSGKLAALQNNADVHQVHGEYLLSQAKQVDAKHVLVFGEHVAKRFVADVSQVYSSYPLGDAEKAMNVHVVESAPSYWQTPASKRQLWLFLQQTILKNADS